MRLVERSPNRLDLRPAGEPGAEALTVSLAGPMSLGAGNTLGGLCGALSLIGLPDPDGFGRLCRPRAHAVPPTSDAFLIRLGVTAARGQPGDPVHIVLAVPSTPGANAKRHLICGRLPGDSADRLRALVGCSGTLGVRMRDIASIGVEWCLVSEERPEMTTRRDRKTPVQSLVGAHVVIVGCGGLGSWIAEFVARAGARRITLSDSAQITGGLLVRQDFTELDVGEKKADALARRLTALRDDLAVDLLPGGNYTLGTAIPSCDLLIDATVDKTAAAAFSAAWPTAKHAPLVASVATDRRSATLGLVTLTRPGHGPDPETLDAAAGKAVEAREDLQMFASFWRSPEPREEVNPAPGCSVPTFHGSAADLAAVAGALIRLIAGHLPAPDTAGTHLFAMPHAGHTAGHVWLDYT